MTDHSVSFKNDEVDSFCWRHVSSPARNARCDVLKLAQQKWLSARPRWGGKIDATQWTANERLIFHKIGREIGLIYVFDIDICRRRCFAVFCNILEMFSVFRETSSFSFPSTISRSQVCDLIRREWERGKKTTFLTAVYTSAKSKIVNDFHQFK